MERPEFDVLSTGQKMGEQRCDVPNLMSFTFDISIQWGTDDAELIRTKLPTKALKAVVLPT
jgi:hypothetical protein